MWAMSFLAFVGSELFNEGEKQPLEPDEALQFYY